MTRELAIRALSLYTPIVVAIALWIWRHPLDSPPTQHAKRVGTAVLLASAWNAVALLIVNVLAIRAGWWTFHVDGGSFAGIPFDLYLGWIVLWGAVPVLAFPSLPIPLSAMAMVAVDLLLMPLSEPVVRLGSWWYMGELVAGAAALAPALYLARWTIDDRSLGWRAALQVVTFSGVVLVLIPTAVLEQTGGTWTPLFDRSAHVNAILVQLLAIPAILGLSAVQEFVVRGRGTPIPYDPPRRLVTTGPYAFVANPMQLAIAGVLVGWAFMLHNVWMIGPIVMTLAYGSGLAAWHEQEELTARFGDRWTAYRREVRQWWPRWRPFVAGARAQLFVAQSCSTCRGVGRWLTDRGLLGLDIVPAELHPGGGFVRLTYQPPGGGCVDEGVAAFARALEHIHLGWAWVGMLMRLPLVRPFLQLIVDASGGYPRPVQPVRTTFMDARASLKRTPRCPPLSRARRSPHRHRV